MSAKVKVVAVNLNMKLTSLARSNSNGSTFSKYWKRICTKMKWFIWTTWILWLVEAGCWVLSSPQRQSTIEPPASVIFLFWLSKWCWCEQKEIGWFRKGVVKVKVRTYNTLTYIFPFCACRGKHAALPPLWSQPLNSGSGRLTWLWKALARTKLAEPSKAWLRFMQSYHRVLG